MGQRQLRHFRAPRWSTPHAANPHHHRHRARRGRRALALHFRAGPGRLPGDIRIESEGGGFYFPIVTCLVISVVLSLVLWLFRR
ncbi:MAG TPA: DUF2905 domain-containing protein [Usitatibacter sp.]|nr:DUF2905 domain-containing protein [Usitatibacter sp.]